MLDRRKLINYIPPGDVDKFRTWVLHQRPVAYKERSPVFSL
jgi:hypothetical protein